MSNVAEYIRLMTLIHPALVTEEPSNDDEIRELVERLFQSLSETEQRVVTLFSGDLYALTDEYIPRPKEKKLADLIEGLEAWTTDPSRPEIDVLYKLIEEAKA